MDKDCSNVIRFLCRAFLPPLPNGKFTGAPKDEYSYKVFDTEEEAVQSWVEYFKTNPDQDRLGQWRMK